MVYKVSYRTAKDIAKERNFVSKLPSQTNKQNPQKLLLKCVFLPFAGVLDSESILEYSFLLVFGT